MGFSKYDIYAFQVVHYLVTMYDYQIIRVKQYEDDIWLANKKNKNYPVVRICSKPIENVVESISYMRQVHRMILDLIQREGRLLILDTTPSSFSLENTFMKLVHIFPNKISYPSLLEQFPHLIDVMHDVENKDQEVADLTKEIEEAQQRQQVRMIEETKKHLRPRATIGLIGIFSIFMCLVLIMQFLAKNNVSGLISVGAYYKLNIIAAKEYFRLITAGFVHHDLFSFLFMMYSLYQIAKLSESLFNKKQYVLLAIGSSFFGYLSMLIANQNTIAFGAGAMIWGIGMAYIFACLENGTYKIPIVKWAILKVIMYMFFTFALPGMSIFGHLGGAIFGVLYSMWVLKSERFPQFQKHGKYACILFAILMIVLGIQTHNVTPINKNIDQSILEVYRNTPMDSYAKYLESCYNKQYRTE